MLRINVTCLAGRVSDFEISERKQKKSTSLASRLLVDRVAIPSPVTLDLSLVALRKKKKEKTSHTDACEIVVPYCYT